MPPTKQPEESRGVSAFPGKNAGEAVAAVASDLAEVVATVFGFGSSMPWLQWLPWLGVVSGSGSEKSASKTPGLLETKLASSERPLRIKRFAGGVPFPPPPLPPAPLPLPLPPLSAPAAAADAVSSVALAMGMPPAVGVWGSAQAAVPPPPQPPFPALEAFATCAKDGAPAPELPLVP